MVLLWFFWRFPPSADSLFPQNKQQLEPQKEKQMQREPQSRPEKECARHLKELWDIFGEKPKVITKMIIPPYRHMFVIDPRTREATVQIVSTPFQVTITLLQEGRAYTFFTGKHEDPFDFVFAMKGGLSPELWAEQMLRACGVGEVDECMYWNWEEYQKAVTAVMNSWQPEDFFTNYEWEEAINDAKSLIKSAPSLFDVQRILQKWPYPDFEMADLVSVYDYIEWDPAYLRGLFLLHRVAKMNIKRPTR